MVSTNKPSKLDKAIKSWTGQIQTLCFGLGILSAWGFDKWLMDRATREWILDHVNGVNIEDFPLLAQKKMTE